MIGLIKKDMLMTRNYAFLFFLCSLFFMGTYLFIKEVLFHSVITDTEFSRTALSILPLFFVMEFSCRNFQFERIGRQSEKYFNSLPISPSGMVISKFAGSIIFTVYGLIMSFMCMTAFTLSDDMPLRMTPYKNIFIAFLFIIIVLTFQMPVLVYNGNELLSLILPIICIVTPICAISLIKKSDINELISSTLNYMSRHHITTDTLIVLILFLTVACMIVSAFLSVQIYKRREF